MSKLCNKRQIGAIIEVTENPNFSQYSNEIYIEYSNKKNMNSIGHVSAEKSCEGALLYRVGQ